MVLSSAPACTSAMLALGSDCCSAGSSSSVRLKMALQFHPCTQDHQLLNVAECQGTEVCCDCSEEEPSDKPLCGTQPAGMAGAAAQRSQPSQHCWLQARAPPGSLPALHC